MKSFSISQVKYGLAIVMLVLFQALSFSQTLLLQMNVEQQPDPDILQWALNPETVIVTITNTGQADVSFKIAGEIKRNGERVADTNPSQMPTLTLGAGETMTQFAEDIVPANAVSLYGDIEQTYIRTNQIPAGFYEICVVLVSETGQTLTVDVCRPFQITAYQQPSLIYPVNGTMVQAGTSPVMAWTPVVPLPSFPVTYRIRIYEDSESHYRLPLGEKLKYGIGRYELVAPSEMQIFQLPDVNVGGVYRKVNDDMEHSKGQIDELSLVERCTIISDRNSGRSNEDVEYFQGGNDELSLVERCTLNDLNSGRSNDDVEVFRPDGGLSPAHIVQAQFPIIDVEVTGQTQLIWPVDYALPEPGKVYIWHVQALNDEGLPLGDNNGFSEIGIFYIGDEGMVEIGSQSIGVFPTDNLPEYLVKLNGRIEPIFQNVKPDEYVSFQVTGNAVTPQTFQIDLQGQLLTEAGGVFGKFSLHPNAVRPQILRVAGLPNDAPLVVFSERDSEQVFGLQNGGGSLTSGIHDWKGLVKIMRFRPYACFLKGGGVAYVEDCDDCQQYAFIHCKKYHAFETYHGVHPKADGIVDLPPFEVAIQDVDIDTDKPNCFGNLPNYGNNGDFRIKKYLCLFQDGVKCPVTECEECVDVGGECVPYLFGVKDSIPHISTPISSDPRGVGGGTVNIENDDLLYPVANNPLIFQNSITCTRDNTIHIDDIFEELRRLVNCPDVGAPICGTYSTFKEFETIEGPILWGSVYSQTKWFDIQEQNQIIEEALIWAKENRPFDTNGDKKVLYSIDFYGGNGPPSSSSFRIAVLPTYATCKPIGSGPSH